MQYLKYFNLISYIVAMAKISMAARADFVRCDSDLDCVKSPWSICDSVTRNCVGKFFHEKNYFL
jgi:hypothetical protein